MKSQQFSFPRIPLFVAFFLIFLPFVSSLSHIVKSSFPLNATSETAEQEVLQIISLQYLSQLFSCNVFKTTFQVIIKTIIFPSFRCSDKEGGAAAAAAAVAREE